MDKIHLDSKQEFRYQTIKRLVETNGNEKAAAVKLGCSIRTIKRLVRIYEEGGRKGFVHKNKGRAPSIKIDESIKRKIIDLYVNEYPDANFTHYCQIIKEDLDIDISAETLRLWLLNENILSPKSHRITRKRIKKKLRDELKRTKTKKKANQIEYSDEIEPPIPDGVAIPIPGMRATYSENKTAL